ncbi:unnamed protein product [Mytilus edulis]|uniref:Uncharacterized protein n=1 Tax=Mytilus edulis TaxID=6550 RepID=A0A8S3T9Z8_MYTED|nr:unnamed protein product [Mytilus edulis]
MLFRLPSNDTFHLVGTKPIIDNKDITHHILLFGCNEQEGQIIPSEEPYECGMLAHRQCVNIIGTWTVGSDGDCFHNSTGFKIGSSGFKLQLYRFDPPLRVNPGDEIRTTCTYSSLSSNETIFFGEGTSDEMCYGFITYYPAQNIALPYCTTWKTVEKCKRYMPQFGGIIDGCKWKDFLSGGNEYIGFMMIELAMHCDTSVLQTVLKKSEIYENTNAYAVI